MIHFCIDTISNNIIQYDTISNHRIQYCIIWCQKNMWYNIVVYDIIRYCAKPHFKKNIQYVNEDHLKVISLRWCLISVSSVIFNYLHVCFTFEILICITTTIIYNFFLGFVLLLIIVYIALKYKLFVEFFVEERMDWDDSSWILWKHNTK